MGDTEIINFPQTTPNNEESIMGFGLHHKFSGEWGEIFEILESYIEDFYGEAESSEEILEFLFYDPDANDWFERAESLGGSFDLTSINAEFTEIKVKTLWRVFFRELKNTNLWDKISEMYSFVGVTYAGLGAKLKHSGIDESVFIGFNSGDYTAAGEGAGLKGNGTNKYCDHLTIFSGENVQNLSYGAYLQTNLLESIMGARNDPQIIQLSQASGSAHMHFGQPGRIDYGSAPINGFLSGSGSASSVRIFQNGILRNAYEGSGGTTVSNPMSWKSFCNGIAEMSPSRINLSYWGTYLTISEQEQLSNIVNQLMTSFGCNVF